MLYLPIKKTWIISRVARRVYFVCALAAFSFFGVLVASVAAFRASGHASPEGIEIAVFIVRLLLWPGLIGTALLSVAMWYFWLGFDNSGWLKRRFGLFRCIFCSHSVLLSITSLFIAATMKLSVVSRWRITRPSLLAAVPATISP